MRKKPYILAMVCHKGGVGKTTTAASLGGVLSSRGKRVLLVDLDAQKNLTETFSGETFPETVATAFVRRGGLPVYPIRKGLDIVPSSDDMCMLDMNFSGVVGKEFILKELLEETGQKYDYVVIDSPAQLGTATANALVAADGVVIPVNGDAYSMGGLNQIGELITAVKKHFNPGMEVLGILMTKFNARRIVDRKVREALDATSPGLRFDAAIRESAAIVQAPLCHMDITVYEPNGRAAEDYARFCRELEKRILKAQSNK